MDADRIAQWARQADAYAHECLATWPGPVTKDAWDELFPRLRDAYLYRLAYAAGERDALERAAKECEDMARRSHSNTAVLIAAAENIRALLTAVDTAAVKERVRRGMGEEPKL